MEPQETLHAPSVDVLVERDVAVSSFLAIDDRPNVAISMRVHVLELLQSRNSSRVGSSAEADAPGVKLPNSHSSIVLSTLTSCPLGASRKLARSSRWKSGAGRGSARRRKGNPPKPDSC